ncbi:MAG: hypothetical protein NTV34_13680, partial [Proteobacteria bacterium]|nr:hypothetical protein [Pseudomonadota bacterium]
MIDEEPNDTSEQDSLEKESPKWTNLPTVSLRKMARKTLGEILTESTGVTSEQIESALRSQTGSDVRLGELLVQKNLVSEEEVLKALAFQLDLPYYNRLPINDIDPALIDSIQIQFCRDNRILPVARDDFNVTVAVADPLNVFPLDDLRLILSTNINMIVCSPTVIDNAINRVYERSNDASQ